MDSATVTSLTFHNHDSAVYVCKTFSYSVSCYDSNVTTEVLFDCITSEVQTSLHSCSNVHLHWKCEIRVDFVSKGAVKLHVPVL